MVGNYARVIIAQPGLFISHTYVPAFSRQNTLQRFLIGRQFARIPAFVLIDDVVPRCQRGFLEVAVPADPDLGFEAQPVHAHVAARPAPVAGPAPAATHPPSPPEK